MSSALELPPIPRDQIAAAGLAALEIGLAQEQIVEAGARAAAALARRLLGNDVHGASVIALAGAGVKASVALSTLRILHGFGAECVAVLCSGSSELRPETLAAGAVCERLGMPMIDPTVLTLRSTLGGAALVIDGLVGLGLQGAPLEPLASLIALANDVGVRALSLECPSGLDPDSGEPWEPTLVAQATLALGLPVAGLHARSSWELCGELWLCDVGYPPEALAAVGLDGRGLWAEAEMIRLR